jgi:hypothetical protein
MSEEKLKHDFSGVYGKAFKAILDESKELGILSRLSLYHLGKLSRAVIDTRQSSNPKGDYQEGIEEGIKIGEARQLGDNEEMLAMIMSKDLLLAMHQNSKVPSNAATIEVWAVRAMLTEIKETLITNTTNQITSEKDL